ncbi:MAG TPA: NAD(P)-dependent oxidoreductase [Victivallales bacterium]|nr:NAD(P)-dependent oxidoreductase [Victivallales bacterium]
MNSNRNNIGIYLKHSLSALNLGKIADKINNDFPKVNIRFIHTKDELYKNINKLDILITWKFYIDLYKETKTLQVIISPSAGRDWVPEDPYNKIINIYGSYHGRLMAETLLSSILSFNNKIDKAILNRQNKIWDRELFCSRRLLGDQNFLILGYGKIGKECAKLIKLFGSNITGLQRQYESGTDELGTKLINNNSLDTALKNSDHIVLILPKTESTNQIIKSRHYKMMKDSAYLYNIGRGNCLQEHELIHALKTHEIAGAYLDVTNGLNDMPDKSSELWSLDNVLLTPHTSAIYTNSMQFYYDNELRSILKKYII